jgi:DNA-binding LytR/AlgR family response regulator
MTPQRIRFATVPFDGHVSPLTGLAVHLRQLGHDGVEAIERHHPDQLFLDIEMPGMSGFDLLDEFVAYLTRQKTGDRIALPTMEGLQILQSEEIYYCESDGGYTHFFLTSGKAVLISKTLKEVEEVLESKGFCRVHHGYLINVRYVQKYIRGDGGEVIMANNKNIPVSRNKKQEFLNLLERI